MRVVAVSVAHIKAYLKEHKIKPKPSGKKDIWLAQVQDHVFGCQPTVLACVVCVCVVHVRVRVCVWWCVRVK